MKNVKLQGEFLVEVSKQIDAIDGMRKTIEDLSNTKLQLEKIMWKHIKKEYPELSDNCSISKIDIGEVLIVDRISD